MFTKEINGLTLTKQIADSLFPNINGTGFRNDVSFLATLRALLHERVPKEESVQLKRTRTINAASVITGSPKRDCIRSFVYESGLLDGCTGIINICSIEGRADEDIETSFGILDETSVKSALGNGYAFVEDLGVFVKRHMKASFYINEETRNVAIFVERLDIKKWHLLQSLIPRYFPWYFKDKPLETNEMALIKAMTNRYAPDYERLIEEFASKFDLRTIMIKNALVGFETRFEKQRLEQTRREQQQIEQEIRSLEQQFSNCAVRSHDLMIAELGLIQKIQDGDASSEVMDYFICNKTLNIVNVTGGCIEFIVTTYVSNFDPDIFSSMINKVGKSPFYRKYEGGGRYGNQEMTDERIEKLMRAIFETEQLHLKQCAAYRLDFGRFSYAGLRSYTYPQEMRDYTPNQHIQHFGCLGNNERYIRDAIKKGNYLQAFENCIASAKNMNMSEPHTVSYCLEHVLGNNAGKYILMPDGSSKTPLDAVIWLEEQEKTTEENTTEVNHE